MDIQPSCAGRGKTVAATGSAIPRGRSATSRLAAKIAPVTGKALDLVAPPRARERVSGCRMANLVHHQGIGVKIKGE